MTPRPLRALVELILDWGDFNFQGDASRRMNSMIAGTVWQQLGSNDVADARYKLNYLFIRHRKIDPLLVRVLCARITFGMNIGHITHLTFVFSQTLCNWHE